MGGERVPLCIRTFVYLPLIARENLRPFPGLRARLLTYLPVHLFLLRPKR